MPSNADPRTPAQVQAQLEQTLRYLSHDMRTPVATLLVLTDKLQARLQGQDDALRQLDAIAQQGRELLRTMDGFLFEARAQGELRLTDCLVDDLLDDALAQVAERAGAQARRIELAPPEGFFFVQVAAQLMVRALHNLLLQALQQARAATPLALTVTQASAGAGASERVAVCVSFEPAEALDAPAALPVPGLGLNYVQLLAQRHGGAFEPRSLPDGRSRWALLLPCTVEPG